MTLTRLSLAASATLFVSCLWGPEQTPYEYLPDMVRSVPYDSFAPNPVFKDGKTLQTPPAGTIARGHLSLSLEGGSGGADRAAAIPNPVEPTAEALARGEEVYSNFCWVCHGDAGLGDGPLIGKYPVPPAYTSTGVRDQKAGRLYHTITFGTGRMPGYRFQITPEDRWRLVHYVQVLQRSSEGRS